MTPEEALALKDIAYRMIALATGESMPVTPIEPQVPVPLPVPTYPRVEVIEGAQFYLKAPISPKWRPSQYGLVFGKKMLLPDPSNAPEGYALRSPAGYPAVYPTSGPIGQEQVIGVARCGYANETFRDDAEVDAYIAAVAASQAGAEKRDEELGYDFRLPSERRNDPPVGGETEIKVEQG
jgi:hypothetical protein